MKMEQLDIEEKISLYTKVFGEVEDRVGEAAALVIVDQIGKHIRIAEIHAKQGSVGTSESGSDDVPATSKQIAFMEQLGLDVPEGISKREASEKLDEELGQ